MPSNIDNRVPFGLLDGRMVSVEEVASGRGCGCVCPSCGGPLVAKKGPIKIHHFAHDHTVQVDCVSASETAIHRMAKQILMEEKRFTIPPLVIKASGTDLRGETHFEEEQLCRAVELEFREVEQEVQVGSRRIDVMGRTARGAVYIEIKVSHKVDADKKWKLRQLDVPVIEVDLAGLGVTVSEAALSEKIISSISNKRWLSFTGYGAKKAELQARVAAELAYANTQIKAARFRERQDARRAFEERRRRLSETPTETRHFLCEHCRGISVYRHSEVKTSASQVSCQHCGRMVSTTPC